MANVYIVTVCNGHEQYQRLLRCYNTVLYISQVKDPASAGDGDDAKRGVGQSWLEVYNSHL